VLIRRQMIGGGHPAPHAPRPAPNVVEGCQTVWEFLARQWWSEDSKARVPGTILLFCDGDRLKVMLNDKDGGCVAFLTLDDGDDLLPRIELALEDPSTDWRVAREPKGKGK